MALAAGELANFVVGETLALAHDYAAPALASWATKRTISGLTKRYLKNDKMLSQGGHVPVTISTGATVYGRKKTTRWKRKVPLSKQISLDKNVITYIWHATTPYHAKYGSIGIGNLFAGTNTQTAYNTDSNAELPMHLYDLTCAPNWVRSEAVDTAEVISNGRAMANPAPFYMFKSTSHVLGNAAVDHSLTPYKIKAVPGGYNFSQIVSQEPDGVRGDNKWYVKYLKKPFSLPDNTDLYDYDEVKVGPAIREDPEGVPKIIVPPVGYRPIHVNTKVRMCLVGCANQAVTYDISLIRLKQDHLVPLQCWRGGKGSYESVTTEWQTGQGQSEDQLNANNAALFWQQLALPFTHGPECAQDRSILRKGIQILGSRVVTIQPKLTIDGDTQLNHEYISFDFKWNDVCSYGWRKDSDYMLNGTIPNYYPAGDDKHGTGFTTSIADLGNLTTHLSPQSRTFLLVRCRSAIITGATLNTENTVTGSTNYGAEGTNDNVPTYDISIENTYIPDHST